MLLSRIWLGFDSSNIQLSDYNFTSATCKKSASSLTLPNTTCFLEVLQFPPVATLNFIRDDPNFSFRENSLELVKLFCLSKVILIQFSLWTIVGHIFIQSLLFQFVFEVTSSKTNETALISDVKITTENCSSKINPYYAQIGMYVL
jgi:hypothetical protein